MAKTTFFVCLFLSLTIHRLPLSFAAFQDPYWSARVASLGGAFTAVSDDPTGIFYNAACTAKVDQRSANFSYAKLFAGLDEVNLSLSQFAYVQPLNKIGVLGIGWVSFNSSQLYREDSVTVSYARNLKELFKNTNGEFSVGVTVRYLTRRFDLDERTSGDPVFSGGNRKHAGTLDLHLYAVPDPFALPGLSLGISVKSINQPDVGFRYKERLPKEVVAGLLYRWKNLAFPIDVSHRAGELRSHFGMEFSMMNERLILRAGSDRSQVGSGFGAQYNINSFTLIFDYAFLWPLEVDKTVGAHRATLGVKF